VEDIIDGDSASEMSDLYCIGWGVKLYSLTHWMDMTSVLLVFVTSDQIRKEHRRFDVKLLKLDNILSLCRKDAINSHVVGHVALICFFVNSLSP